VSRKQGSHLHHESLTLQDAATAARSTIDRERGRLAQAGQRLNKNVSERELDRQHMEEKRAQVEAEIRQRRERIMAAADK
jgi:hypothetical protein